MTRATMSGRPPAACGTIILTGREGQLCALAISVRTRAASSERNAQRMILSVKARNIAMLAFRGALGEFPERSRPRRRARSLAPCNGNARARLPREADPPHRSLRRGRRERQRRAPCRQAPVRQARPAASHRQPARSGRRAGRGARGEVGARRLHAVPRRRGKPRSQPESERQSSLRPDPRLRARGAARICAARVGGAPLGSRRFIQGLRRSRALPTRAAQLRLERQRQLVPPRRRDVRFHDGRGHGPRALQGTVAGAHRSAERPGAADVQQRGCDPAPRQVGKIAGPRGDGEPAPGFDAEPSDDRGIRPARLRSELLVRCARACGDAAGDRRATERRARESASPARGENEPARRGRGADRRHPGAVRRPHPLGKGAPRQTDPGNEDPPGMSESSNPYTRGVAEFVSGLRYEAIPRDVRERAKLLVLDSLGCALYGAHLQWCRILQRTLGKLDGSRACRVWGTAQRLSAPHAALANGTQVQGFELDDVHREGVLHVGAVVLPALVAVAELRGMSGREFLTAAVAGYEIGPRVGLCMGQEHIGQGWHSGATLGVFSAASGAAAALRLSADQTVHALGIAGTQSSGLMAAQYGAMVKRMHAGRSAQSGLYGALLAEDGFTGIADVFESPYGGFCTTFSRSQDRFNRAELTAGLGENFETMSISLKFYSCVGTNHTTLDAIRLMQARHPFGPDDVERIVVRCSQATLEHAGWTYRPEGMTSAQLNLSYCAAVLLLEGDVFVDQFSEAALADPRRLALAAKVEAREDPAITARGSKSRHTVHVTVLLTDGTTLEETVETPRGSERHFPEPSDV